MPLLHKHAIFEVFNEKKCLVFHCFRSFFKIEGTNKKKRRPLFSFFFFSLKKKMHYYPIRKQTQKMSPLVWLLFQKRQQRPPPASPVIEWTWARHYFETVELSPKSSTPPTALLVHVSSVLMYIPTFRLAAVFCNLLAVLCGAYDASDGLNPGGGILSSHYGHPLYHGGRRRHNVRHHHPPIGGIYTEQQ